MARQSPADVRPTEVAWHEDIPEGKLDLLVSSDFRMTSTTLLSDVVFPAATWYEKHDLSTTDMHPFIHAFTPAIDPPWEAKTDFETFHLIARKLSDLARTHLGTRNDLVSVPMQHDTPARRRNRAVSYETGCAATCHPSPAGRCRSSKWSNGTTQRSPTS
jgi:nitrate reductase alpha subunit